MKIRFIQTLSTTRETYRRHTVHDLPEADAQHMVNAGMAVEAVETVNAVVAPPAPRAEPQQQPRPKKSKKQG